MSSMLNPPVQGGAFDDFMAATAPASRNQRRWQPEDGPMPALYLGHGAPPLFNDALWIDQLFAWAQSLPKPTAILIVSAHWESAPLALSAPAAGTPLVYDFGGFHRRYFEMTYSTPDASVLSAPGQRAAVRHRARARAPEQGTRPRRLGPAQGDVPVRRRPGAAAQPADPRPGPAAADRGAAQAAARAGRIDHRVRLPDPRPAVPQPGQLGVQPGPGLVGRLRRLGGGGTGCRRPRPTGRLPPRSRHAVRAPDRRALHADLRHPRGGHRSGRADRRR